MGGSEVLDTLVGVSGLGVAGVSWRAVARTEGTVRVAWVCFGAAMALFGAAVTTEHLEIVPGVLRVLAYAATAAALYFSPGVRRRLCEWLVLLLDGWMLGGCVFVLVWTFAVSPRVTGPATDLRWTHDLVLVAVDLLAASVVFGLARRTGREERRGVLAVCATAFFACGADLLHVLGHVTRSEALGLLSHGSWVLAMGAAAAAAALGPLELWASTAPGAHRTSYARVPHIVVGATCVAVVAAVTLGREVDPVLGVLGCSLVVALVAQMLLLLHDNSALTSDLSGQALRMQSLLQRSSDVIVVCDLDAQVTYVSPALQAVFGYDPEHFTGETLLAIVHPDDVRAVRREVQRLLDGHPSRLVQCRLRHADGTWRVAESTASTYLEDGTVTGLIFNSRDVTDRIVLERELAHRASHDELTGLANRRHFTEHLARALDGLADGERLAVLYMDLDGFKAVNDSAGHAAGDALLAEASRRLAGSLRAGDVIARFGGDEFAAVLVGVDPDAVLGVAARLREAVSRPYLVGDREVVVRTSIGVAFSSPGTQVGELLRNADLAMYRAKATGRNRVEVYAPHMHADLVRRVELESELRRALATHSFELHYQPIVDLGCGGVPRVEALLRWRRGDGRLCSPADFIEVAEESGLILPLGGWVLDTALAQLRRWRDEGLEVGMSVNLSGRQLAEDTIVDDVLASLAQAGVEPGALTLEITESVLLDSFELSRARLSALRAHGVCVALDDFGTGYSGLSYLRGLAVDQLKLDRTFVAGLGVERERTVLVRALVSLASDLGLMAVAEGVETPQQLAMLQEMGCPRAQGYLFARPAPAHEIATSLRHGFTATLLGATA